MFHRWAYADARRRHKILQRQTWEVSVLNFSGVDAYRGLSNLG